MPEVFSGDGLQWVTIFIVIFCFWWQGKRREEQWSIDQDQRMAIIKRLQKLEKK